MSDQINSLGQLTWDKLLFVSGILLLFASYLNKYLIPFGAFFISTGLFVGYIKEHRRIISMSPDKKDREGLTDLSIAVFILYLIILFVIIGVSVYYYFIVK